jgi:hypothetical protein
MQQVVGAWQGIGDAEFCLQDANHVDAAERAHTIRRLRLRIQARPQLRFRGACQPRGLPGTRTILQRLEPTVAVAIDPVLHETPTAAELVSNLCRLEAAQGQEYAAIALTPPPITPGPCSPFENLRIVRITRFNIHPTASLPRRTKHARPETLAQYLTCAELRAKTNQIPY